MANMNGNKYSEIFPNPYPINTPIISRIPIDMAISNVRRFDTPASINGAIITIPSGMFVMLYLMIQAEKIRHQ